MKSSLVFLLLLGATAWAQSTQAVVLESEFHPGLTLRYGFEGSFDYQSQAEARTVNEDELPAECAYKLRVAFRSVFEEKTATGTVRGKIVIEDPATSNWKCSDRIRKRVEHYFYVLKGAAIPFEIHPGGEVIFEAKPADESPEKLEPAEVDGFNLFRKTVWDSLQKSLNTQPVLPGPAQPTKAFLYFGDSFEDGLELASSSLVYRENTLINGRELAILDYQQVLTPDVTPAYTPERAQADDFDGVNVIAGETELRVLFDVLNRRIAYVARSRRIDNEFAVQYGDERERLARCVLKERSVLRLLPESDTVNWLAALQKFEERSAEPPARVAGTPEPGSVAALAKSGRKLKKLSDDESEEQRPVPAGFQQWTRTYCHYEYCFDLSIAIPAGEVLNDRDNETMLAASRAGTLPVIAIGPTIFSMPRGLRPNEIATSEGEKFLARKPWFAAAAGTVLASSESSVDDRIAVRTEFRSQSFDLRPMKGTLLTVLVPYNQVLHIACIPAREAGVDQQTVCQTVLSSIRIR